MKSKWKVYCAGPGCGKDCPFNATKIYKDKIVLYRCDACWKTLSIYERRNTIVIVNANGYTPEWIAFQKKLDLYTHHWDDGPHGLLIRIGWDGRPVEYKYWNWWNLKHVTKDQLPEGYSWCEHNKFPMKFNDPPCSFCPRHRECNKIELETLRQKQKEVNKQLREVKEKVRTVKVEEALKKDKQIEKIRNQQQNILNKWLSK